MMDYKKMREYTHEEFVELVKSLSEEELLQIKHNKYNMEQLLIYVKKLESGYKEIDKILYNSQNLLEIEKIVNEMIQYI